MVIIIHTMEGCNKFFLIVWLVIRIYWFEKFKNRCGN
jgi:hypothetical protein